MVYDVYYIKNLASKPITIYVSIRPDSPFFYSDNSQVTLAIGGTLTVEEDRLDLSQIRNLVNLRQLQASKQTRYNAGTRLAQIEVNFGYGENIIQEEGEVPFYESDMAVTTVSDNLVTSSSMFFCSVSDVSTDDHNNEDAAIERIQVYVANVVPGVGYDVIATAQIASWGKYKVNVMISTMGG